MKKLKIGVQEMYSSEDDSYDQFLEKIDQSLKPRPPGLMYDKFQAFKPTSESYILDAGCRDARHMCILAEKYEGHYEGIDIVQSNIDDALKEIAEMKLQDRINVQLGDLQELPYKDNQFDIIWCRDVLGHMDDLKKTFESFYRVLKPKGKVMIFLVTTTDLITSEEAEFICDNLATFRENIDPTYFEQAFESAGFKCIEKDVISSEWREAAEEDDRKISSKQILRIAKLIRNKDNYIDMFGETDYYVELANCHYGVYQMLGKLCPIIYTLEK